MSVEIEHDGAITTATLSRPEAKNAIDVATLDGLHAALDAAESEPARRVLVLRGRGDTFCAGMDLSSLPSLPADGRSPYMELLTRFAKSPVLVVAAIEGDVVAGGVGLVAASDLALAAPGVTLALSEAALGMLPAQVLPFLIRRAGFQVAYRMTLTTAPIDAEAAARAGVVDEVAPDPVARARWYARRARHVPRETMAEAKAYFRRLWILDEDMEAAAVGEFSRLLASPRFRARVADLFGEEG